MGKPGRVLLARRLRNDRQCMCPVYEDFNGGCPNRLNTYRPSYMKPLNPSVDLWSYYNLSATFQVCALPLAKAIQQPTVLSEVEDPVPVICIAR